jgi:proteasome lid subunit RPN8/RPN11
MEVYIDKECWDKIINYAKAAYHTEKCEIGGMSVVTQDKDGDWLIQEPVILKQEIGGTTCDLDKEELAKYYTQMAVKYNKTNFRFCWWHSHHTMGAFWSGTDISSIEEYGEGESDLSFALVVNLKEEYKCRVSVWKPVEIHQDVELNILNNEPDVEIPLDIVTEVKEKCETRTYNHVGYSKIYKTQNNNSTLPLWDDTRNNWNNYKLLEDDLTNVYVPNQQEIANFEAKYEYAVMKITEFIRQVTIGDWSMHKFKKAIRETNKQIVSYGVQIEELNKKELQEFTEMDSAPYELIICDNKFADIADAMMEVQSYNGGYMI